jgi:hypothetical protein
MGIFPWTWSRGFDLIKKSRCGCARPGGRAGTWNQGVQCSTLKKRLPQWIIRLEAACQVLELAAEKVGNAAH